tara:strand:+ start:1442 stop:2272 length:831 start_codon:yes stop_codon:yes gene_type:complete
MAYLGNVKPTETTSSVLRSTYTGDGSTTTYNLPGPVANETSIIATINGVTQQDTAYSTNGSQIIFSGTPALGDAIELRTISGVGLSYAPSAGSVTTGILADGAVTSGKINDAAITTAKLGVGAAVANIGARAITAAQVPAGSVLQVVHSVITSAFGTSSSSYVDSGLTATITPTSSTSKIFALLSISFQSHGSAGFDGSGNFNIVRGSTQLQQWRQRTYSYNGSGVYLAVPNSVYMDSPATTSATTYKVQILSNAAVSGMNSELGSSCITLFEIAA